MKIMKTKRKSSISRAVICAVICAGTLASCGNVLDEEAAPIASKSTLVRYADSSSADSSVPDSSSQDDSSKASDESRISEDSSDASEAESSAPDISSATESDPVYEAIDHEPPVVTANDISVYKDGSVSYKKLITVTDNSGEECEVVFDTSDIDLSTVGQYNLPVKATDPSGNVTNAVVKVFVVEKPADPQSEVDVYLQQRADDVLRKILTPDMSQMQQAYAIYFWTKYNIRYTGYSDKSNYKNGAKQGFQTRMGDCYTYYAVAKVLLDAAGIPNVDVIKLRNSDKEERHYWSLIDVGTGWYHFDCTYYNKGNYGLFMMTDAEVAKWDVNYRPNNHRFSAEGLPDRATESVQKQINYGSTKLK